MGGKGGSNIMNYNDGNQYGTHQSGHPLMTGESEMLSNQAPDRRLIKK
jgi:hypothetical protein